MPISMSISNQTDIARHRAHELYVELRDNVVGTVLDEWERTGCLWEQYSPDDGRGQRNHPFSGWSALALLAGPLVEGVHALIDV